MCKHNGRKSAKKFALADMRKDCITSTANYPDYHGRKNVVLDESNVGLRHWNIDRLLDIYTRQSAL